VASLHPDNWLFGQVTSRTRHQRYDQPRRKANGSRERALNRPENNHLTQRGFVMCGGRWADLVGSWLVASLVMRLCSCSTSRSSVCGSASTQCPSIQQLTHFATRLAHIRQQLMGG
jgi:hypothetical protein